MSTKSSWHKLGLVNCMNDLVTMHGKKDIGLCGTDLMFAYDFIDGDNEDEDRACRLLNSYAYLLLPYQSGKPWGE